MAGVMQSEYSLPREQCVALCDDLNSGLLASSTPEVSDREFLLQLRDGNDGKSQPFLSFWTSPPTDKNRRVALHWIAGQEDLAAKVEDLVRRHGGVVSFGTVARAT